MFDIKIFRFTLLTSKGIEDPLAKFVPLEKFLPFFSSFPYYYFAAISLNLIYFSRKKFPKVLFRTQNYIGHRYIRGH